MKDSILRMSLLLMCAVQATFACEERSLDLRKVSPDLTVVVTHRDRPIAGIEVQVVPEKSTEPVFTGSTDENGTILIRRLTAGRYYVTASHADFEAGREWIEVGAVPDAKTKRRLDFQWADSSYETSRVAGSLTGRIPGNTGNKLMDIARPVKTIYPGVDIMLRNAFSGDEYRTVSDNNGAFLISNVPDGIYVLTIAGGMKSITGIAEVTRQVIDVKRTISRASLPLQLRDTGCYRTEFQLADDPIEASATRPLCGPTSTASEARSESDKPASPVDHRDLCTGTSTRVTWQPSIGALPPPESQITAGCNVPSPLPNNTPNTPSPLAQA